MIGQSAMAVEDGIDGHKELYTKDAFDLCLENSPPKYIDDIVIFVGAYQPHCHIGVTAIAGGFREEVQHRIS